MQISELSRAALGSFSSVKLHEIAENFGIESPESLSREQLINEISAENGDAQDAEEAAHIGKTLAETYNETLIWAVLRNKNWIYAFWDVNSKAHCSKELLEKPTLRICYFANIEDSVPCETSIVEIESGERSQSILFKQGFACIRVDFVRRSDNSDILASSRKIYLPRINRTLKNWHAESDIPEILRVSGFNSIWIKNYL